MSGLVNWAFRSPVRLGSTIVVCLVAAIGLSIGYSALADDGRSSAGNATHAPATNGGNTFGTDSPGGPNAAQKFLATAVAFAQAWAQVPAGSSDQQWHAKVRALATSDFARALDTTDPGGLPGGSPTSGAALTFISETSALARVPLSSGTQIMVTIVHSGQNWLVSDVQPAVGN